MRRSLTALLFTVALPGLALCDEARLLRYPDIHGDQVVFHYAGDLWTVSAEGGVARRLTTHAGMELLPKFSPDGKQIAFSAQYDGNTDLFVIPAVGGEPKRLTYHPFPDNIVDWYPDGESVLFRSIRSSVSYRFKRLHRVSVRGGFVEVLPLPEGELTSFNADGSKIAYNRMSRETRTWKRYRGGMAQDIWIYDFANNAVEQITDFDGTDAFPMWHGDKIYFISDRERVMNIYSYDLDSKETKQITRYKEYDVKWPSLGPGAIVYENGGYLYVLDLATERSRKLNVEVYDDKTLARASIKNVQGYIHNFDISPTGARALFEARGEIFTVPAKKGDIRNLTRTPGVRERYPTWSPDGKWVAYFSDASGEFELYIRGASGKGEVKQLTSGSKTYYMTPGWSPDSKKILISDVGVNLYYIDIESKEVTKVDNSDYSATGNYFFGVWSPDSKWIAYSKPTSRSGFNSIFLYSLEEGKSNQVTGEMTDESSPAFDPDGKYLYFITSRAFNPSFSAYEFNYIHVRPSKVVVATLQADAASPFPPESDEEKVKEEEKNEDKEKEEEGEEAKKEDKDAEEEKAIEIDLEGLGDRLVSLDVPDGNYAGILAAKEKVFVYSLPVMGASPQKGPQGKLHVFDMKKREFKEVISGLSGAAISADGKKVLYRSGNNYGIVDAKPGQKPGSGKLNLSGMQMTVNPKAEWRQMFFEAWRMTRDYFYDPNMHGADWDKIKKRYGDLLPGVAHRDDLNYLIGEMIAELSSSHTYRGGGEYPRVESVNVGLLGCEFEPDEASGYYKIAKIFRGENWNPDLRGPLTQPGLNVKEGEYLIEVNGRELRYPTNPWSRFQNTANKIVTLKVNSEPKAEGAREIEVRPVASDMMHRYLDWVAANRRKVSEATGGRVGYIHVPDTAFGGMYEFSRTFYPQVHKDALIIDVRYNSGGFVPDIYLERLQRTLLNSWATRYTTGFVTPASAHFGPKVCIINAYAGSGGDAFPYYFRKLGLGPLIGKRTWGGLIGISGTPPLMDNGSVRIADFSFYNTEGEWEVENRGVSPDIDLDNRPDLVVSGRDPQLEKAIEVVLQKLEEEPSPIPNRPRSNPKR